MKRYSTADLRKLEIINVCDGSCLGYASDFEFEAAGDCSRMVALIIRGSCGLFGFGGSGDLIIPWHTVQCIGEDAILVQIKAKDQELLRLPHKAGK